MLGSAPDNLDRYSEILPVSTATGQFFAGGAMAVMNGQKAYFNSYTATSVQDFGAFAAANPTNLPGAAALLRKTNVGYVKPETVKAFDLGYRGQLKGFSYDINGYYNIYNDFLGNINVVAPLYGASETFDFTQPTSAPVQTLHALANSNFRAFQLYTNTDIEIKSLGFGFKVLEKSTKILSLVLTTIMHNLILINQKIQVLKQDSIHQNTELKLR